MYVFGINLKMSKIVIYNTWARYIQTIRSPIHNEYIYR